MSGRTQVRHQINPGDATGVGAFKAAMKARGIIDHATMAATVTPLDDATVEKVRGVLAEVGLLPVTA